MLLISIGYSSCHWCHVMEKESFMDEGVAEIMNNNFVCIKVDREERPDVDQVYMNAVQLITGSGGWPLNCFALPDGRPFFGGTYFRKEQWKQLLENVHLLFQTRRNDLEEQAGSLSQGVIQNDLLQATVHDKGISSETINDITDALRQRFDHVDGGMTGVPKFPMPAVLSFLLDQLYFLPDEEIAGFLKTSLRKMAFGGIYDQLGGGFSRYSTDAQWKVPHFEKMLYDNAQLVSLYSRAWLKWKEPLYKDTAQDTLDFLLKEMAHPLGGFFSSFDADSEGVEGKYYTWGTGEFKKALESNVEMIAKYYQLGGKALWESNRNILIRSKPAKEFAHDVGLQPSQFRNILKSGRKQLLKVRKTRVAPTLDDKVLTSWNGLMLKALSEAYAAFEKPAYLAAALKCAGFLTSRVMDEDGRLNHSWKDGKASINAFLEDYAFVADGLVSLYQVTFEEKYLKTALQLADYTLQHFYDEENGMFYVTSSLDPPLIARKKEIFDNVIPASNSVMARVLNRLGLLYERDDLVDISTRMLQTVRETAVRYPSAFSHWASVMLSITYPLYTIAIAGPKYQEKAAALRKDFNPSVILAASGKESRLPVLHNRFVEGETMIYVCTGRECKLPTPDLNVAREQLTFNG